MAKSRENLENHIRERGYLFNFDGTGHGATDEQRLDSPTRHRFTSQARSAIEGDRPLKADHPDARAGGTGGSPPGLGTGRAAPATLPPASHAPLPTRS